MVAWQGKRLRSLGGKQTSFRRLQPLLQRFQPSDVIIPVHVVLMGGRVCWLGGCWLEKVVDWGGCEFDG